MSSFITVDNDTWDYIMGAVDQVFDPYAVVGNDIATPYFKVHCSEAEKLQLSVTIVDQNGESVDFVIPGSSLVKPNVSFL
jgi:thioester reductase-like protein